MCCLVTPDIPSTCVLSRLSCRGVLQTEQQSPGVCSGHWSVRDLMRLFVDRNIATARRDSCSVWAVTSGLRIAFVLVVCDAERLSTPCLSVDTFFSVFTVAV